MDVSFYLEDDLSKKLFERSLNTLPAEGSGVVHHADGDTKRYRVVAVISVFEDREWYNEHPELPGDVGVVILTRLSGTNLECAQELGRPVESAKALRARLEGLLTRWRAKALREVCEVECHEDAERAERAAFSLCAAELERVLEESL